MVFFAISIISKKKIKKKTHFYDKYKVLLKIVKNGCFETKK